MKKSNARIVKFFRVFSFLMFFALAASVVFGQPGKTTEIYDGRNDSSSAPLTPGEHKLIEKEVRDKESEIREKNSQSEVCREDEDSSFSISGWTGGSFTRPGARQKAYLYELCRSGRDFGIGGIVVTENDRVVAHYVYGENGLDREIETLLDINQNGFSEILLIGGGSGQGYTTGAVEIIELAPGGVKSYGIADTYEDNFGTEKPKKIATAYRITAQPGADPVYFRETYTRRSEQGRWILTGKSQKYALRRDYEAKYYKIS